ncbi:MAG: type VI secretion system-associated FHA domain protein TagH [Cellvibrionaceae bacterium]|nr:type VI secretion system-associated FHA domain protein TagH [Cellvibrionaceae bacterium]|tara:strand:+ start:37979 stop:40021 length:2043 start_codon:yes stop_codon:yes gene_type:complete
MDLTLTVTEAPEDVNMINHTKAFSAEGGSLGRADKNTWVLPDNDRVVSSTHATISFKNDQYLVTDTSTNGTFHNDSEQPIGSNNITALTSGDTLRIGNYRIKVSIKSDQKPLGKGLQSADFLDGGDKTTFSAAVQSEQESLAQVKQLDGFLDQPSATNQPNTNDHSRLLNNDSLQSWNNTGSQSVGLSSLNQPSSLIHGDGNQVSQDPLELLNTSSGTSSTGAAKNTLDPMAQWESAGPQSTNNTGWQDSDDDWWMESSQADNASALAHVIPNETVSSPPPEEPNPVTPTSGAPYSSDHLTRKDTALHQAAPQPIAQPIARPEVSPRESIADEHYNSPHSQNGSGSVSSPNQQATGQPILPPRAENPQHLANNQPPVNNATQSSAGTYTTPPPAEAVAEQPILSGQPKNLMAQHQTEASPQGFHSAPQLHNSAAVGQQPMTQQSAPTQQHLGEQATHLPHAVSQPPVAQQPYGAPQTSYGTQPAVAASSTLAQSLGLGELPEQQLSQLESEASGIVTETINRLIDLLRARSSIKNELRVQRTMIQATDNNPLKFSASASEAMRLMFSPGNHSYLSPNEAVQDSFDDLSDHQVAVLAGMRAAYDTMLKHFDPENLDRRFKNPKGMLSNKKAKNWEDFQEHYANLLRDGESTYEMLFGEEFGSSYEKQLSELKNARSLTKTQ